VRATVIVRESVFVRATVIVRELVFVRQPVAFASDMSE
jgi:hypothetical protein